MAWRDSLRGNQRELLVSRYATDSEVAALFVMGRHQEIGKILLRPRELMSAVVRGHERHKLVTALYWARNAAQ
jgi:hypothetical protein